MNDLNLSLFHAVAAGHAPHAATLAVALFVLEYSGMAVLALLSVGLWRKPGERATIVLVLLATMLVSVLAKNIAAAIGFPRPFMAGLSAVYTDHAVRPGFPSTHASSGFALAFMLLVRPRLRLLGGGVLALLVPTLWSRIYTGLHFPRDIAAGAMLGAACAAVSVGLEYVWRRRLRPALAARDPAALAVTEPGRSWLVQPALRSAWGTRLMSSARTGPLLVAAACVVGAVLLLAMPGVVPAGLLQHGGAVDSGTTVFYGVTLICVCVLRFAALTRVDRVAIATLLVVLATSEADLHLRWLAVLRQSLRLPGAVPGGWAEVALLVVLVPAVVALWWIFKRYGPQPRVAGTSWHAPMATAATVGVLLVLEIATGPYVIGPWASPAGPRPGLAMLQAVHELLQLAIPLTCLLALWQARFAGRDRGEQRRP
ncbi:phosphatase PAP2 family protein [Xylophilus ampelinus]|uniref:PAP2 superfamily protein n=1 Tax=Xylophilus ampelinus TaxID=54067 RepID=A0A318SL79_9BURK|nr:phosphatase PAP2 family protein [Xylophilus ampelinus]MCS4509110.1 phosphatase PAP2 family protein [Xylophilus ampelinus]PYE79863.1 PAP2 superfamily protein [Xylophilus ampelinus]